MDPAEINNAYFSCETFQVALSENVKTGHSTKPSRLYIAGLMSIHAFAEQLRFVKGGAAKLPDAFWEANDDDVGKVKKTLIYLVHGADDFIQRLHDVLYTPSMKLAYFGRFCALELYGTIKSDVCPPMNGRMAKALRFLGFDVRGD